MVDGLLNALSKTTQSIEYTVGVAGSLKPREPLFGQLLKRLREPRRFIQVVAGPRQVGKTTLVRQALEASGLSYHYASADEPALRGAGWTAAQWEIGRARARDGRRGGVLALDEIHKIPDWSETVKRLWDEDTAGGARLRTVLLGSSPLLVQRGLTESLAGRFEVIPVRHWSFGEMRESFGWDLDQYVCLGGYPGAAPLARDEERWRRYILDSLIETTVARDILLLTRVDKPALLRQLFALGCQYSAQVLSYQKMLGQLQDAGNSTTLAHYLELLGGAGLLVGLQKYSGSKVRQRGSSPKLLALNTALVSALLGRSCRDARHDHAQWGRLVETAVGAHLVNSAAGANFQVFYWRQRSYEVDYVIASGKTTIAIEVTTQRDRDRLPGVDEFQRHFTRARALLVGPGGIPVDEFLSTEVAAWL